MKTRNRLCAALLMAALIVGLLPTYAFADGGVQVDPPRMSFGAKLYGYDPIMPAPLKISNNTSSPVMLISLAGGSSFNYWIPVALPYEMPANSHIEIPVSPNTGLEAGTYTEDLEITTSAGITSASLVFSVEAIDAPTFQTTLNMNGGAINVDGDAWKEITSMDFDDGSVQQIPTIDWMNEEIASGTWIKAPADSEYIGVEITDANGTKTYDPGKEYTVNSNATVKVLWKSTKPVTTTHTVTFKDGEAVLLTQSVESGKKATKPSDPTKDGHTFGGWFADPSLSTAFDFDRAISADTVAYAKFTANKDNPPTKVTYTVTNGANKTWTKGSNATSTITVKRSEADDTCLSHFSGVEVDGKALEKDTDYTVAAGSTVVTLKASALQKLSVGSHTVTITFDDGEASTGLTVKAASSGTNSNAGGSSKTSTSGQATPKTGDEGGPAQWFATAIVLPAAMLLVLLGIRTRMRQEGSR